MPVDPDYELWATQHALVDVQCVQVLEFQHQKWGSLWITDYGAQFTGKTETNVSFTAEPVAFRVDPPKSGVTTQQEFVLRMDALGGYVISNIRNMTDAERNIPIKLVWRLYLDSKPNAPSLDPLDFYIVDVSATRLVVEIRAAATILPNVAAGIRYTIDRFPTLAYL